MRRSASVTIAAAFSLLGSVLSLALGLLSAVSVLIARKSNPDLNEPLVLGGVAIGTFFLVVPAIWGIATSTGLFRLRAWARISILIFSVLLAITGVFGAILFPFVQLSPDFASSGLTGLKFGLGGFYAILAGIGVWWFVLFTRLSVRQEFGANAVRVLNSAEQPALDYPRAKAATSAV